MKQLFSEWHGGFGRHWLPVRILPLSFLAFTLAWRDFAPRTAQPTESK